MNEAINWKTIILILAIIYFISPIDLMPLNGLDDAIVLGAAALPHFGKA